MDTYSYRGEISLPQANTFVRLLLIQNLAIEDDAVISQDKTGSINLTAVLIKGIKSSNDWYIGESI
jgi:hypothetical protein